MKLYSLLDHHRALLLLLLFIIQPFVQRNTTATRTLNASLIMSSIIVNQFSLLETASSDWPGRKLSTGEQRPNNTKCDVRMLRTFADTAATVQYVLDFGLNSANSRWAVVVVFAAPFAVAVADAVHLATV